MELVGPVRARVQVDGLGAEEGLDLDLGGRVGGDLGARLDVECDPHLVAVQVGGSDLADLDPGHHHLVVGADAGGVGEQRCRLEGAGEDPALEEQSAGGEHQDDGERDGADDVGVALAEGLG